MVMQEMAKPRDAFVMVRGQYDKPGDKVEPGMPAVLPPLKKATRRPADPARPGAAGSSRRSTR